MTEATTPPPQPARRRGRPFVVPADRRIVSVEWYTTALLKARAKHMAGSDGVSLSTWINRLVISHLTHGKQ